MRPINAGFHKAADHADKCFPKLNPNTANETAIANSKFKVVAGCPPLQRILVKLKF